jgi:polyisoprenoid-binding protein YceI
MILHRFLFCMLLWIPIFTFAAPPIWKIVPNESNITFTATQNNAPVSGEFKSFSGTIQFDPNDLKESIIKIVVDLNSLTTAYKEVGDTLKTQPWFDIQVFPHATFSANQFEKTGNNSYQAKGTLSLRDKSLPVALTFTLDTYTDTKAHAKGSTTLSRTAYGVGQGEWAKTSEIKDDVKVDFVVSAVK